MNGIALIVGLGNPGPEYRNTRHNAGFMLADLLAERWRVAWRMEKKFFAEIADTRWAERRMILCRPQTYMNVSGQAVGKVAEFFKVRAADTLALVDDADLPFGTLRLRPGGSSGGHHGLESVESALGTRDYPRIRLGIARPKQAQRDIVNHVLAPISSAEWPVWQQVLQRAAQQVECWAAEGVAVAMSRFNGALPAELEPLTNAERKCQ